MREFMCTISPGKKSCKHKWVTLTVRNALGEERSKIEYNGKMVEVKRENFGDDIASQITFALAKERLALKLIKCQDCGKLRCSDDVFAAYIQFAAEDICKLLTEMEVEK